MVGSKHCCWGECKTDSRYPDRWPKSLKELNESGEKVFIPFPKPTGKNFEKCKRWIVACSREHFTDKCITRNTYICALHWPGGKGPTAEFPDPLKANLTTAQTDIASLAQIVCSEREWFRIEVKRLQSNSKRQPKRVYAQNEGFQKKKMT